jgi:tRNA G37 N-methylase TrmD
MNRLIIAALSFALPLLAAAAEYESTLLVQTGKLRESDMVVRTITDLESNKICLTFYVRTVGTSPAMTCYDAVSGFKSSVNQVGFFKEGELVVRKVKDFDNSVSCLVAYVSTPGTSPAIDCYKAVKPSDDAIVRAGHLHEGDLDVQRLADPDSTKTCLIAYVATGGTSPSLTCYNSLVQPGEGGIVQTSQLREGDLLVRKVIDQPNQKTCLITYVSTRGTSPYFYCFDERSPKGAPPPRP